MFAEGGIRGFCDKFCKKIAGGRERRDMDGCLFGKGECKGFGKWKRGGRRGNGRRRGSNSLGVQNRYEKKEEEQQEIRGTHREEKFVQRKGEEHTEIGEALECWSKVWSNIEERITRLEVLRIKRVPTGLTGNANYVQKERKKYKHK